MSLIFVAAIFICAISFYLLFKDKLFAGVGTLLYLTMPYSFFLFFDNGEKRKALIWALLPLVLLAAYNIVRKEYLITSIIANVVLLSFFEWLYPVYGLVIVCVELIWGLIIWNKAVIFTMFGNLLISPILSINMWRFIILGDTGTFSVELQSITSKGYYLGYYFFNWLYKDGNPGMGFGLGFSLLILIWYIVMNKETIIVKPFNRTWWILGLLLFLSYQNPLWDFSERVHPAMLRIVSCIDSPAIFFGLFCVILSPLCIKAQMALLKDKTLKYNKVILGFIVVMEISGMINMFLNLER